MSWKLRRVLIDNEYFKPLGLERLIFSVSCECVQDSDTHHSHDAHISVVLTLSYFMFENVHVVINTDYSTQV